VTVVACRSLSIVSIVASKLSNKQLLGQSFFVSSSFVVEEALPTDTIEGKVRMVNYSQADRTQLAQPSVHTPSFQ
jgi:hypothetical protein